MYYGEKLNSITHLIGTAFSLVGLGALVTVGYKSGSLKVLVSYIIFGVSSVLLYSMSTLYHSMRHIRLKHIFRKLDHIAIYILIAGTYTPYLLVGLGGFKGHLILSFVWGMAIIGILLDVFIQNRIEILQVSIYMCMGWTCCWDFNGIYEAIPVEGFYWLALGGACYCTGLIFYIMDQWKVFSHAHGIWHIWVMAGTLFHFISIIGYIG